MIGFIGGVRMIGNLFPTILLAVIASMVVYVVVEHLKLQDDLRTSLVEIAQRDQQIAALTIRITEAEEARVRDVEAIEAEIARSDAQRLTFSAARSGIEGLNDGETAPVLDEALELLR